MDSRLLKAAQLGDVASLRALLDENPLILEQSAVTPTAGTPLHVAALAGKADFVHEIILRKPSFAWELNQDGFSPLHIASAVGNKDVVVELLKLDPNLCLQEDKQGLIPLHYAAIKGRVSIIKELLKICPESLTVRTSNGQTVLHLAVKNCQFETFKTLVETLDGHEVENFVMAMDKDGNTVPKMAASSKQLKVLEYLKSMETISADDLEKGNPEEEVAETEPRRPKEPGRSRRASRENMLLVAASVIATITFQGISPPEAIFKGGMDLAKNCTLSSVFSPKESSCPRAMRYFFLSMVFNTAGFFAAVWLLSVSRSSLVGPAIFCTAIYCMTITYILQTVAMYPKSTLLVMYIYGLVLFYVILLIEIYLIRESKKRYSKKYKKLIETVPSDWRKMMLLLDTSDEEE